MTTPRIATIAAATLIAVSASLTGVAHADTGLTRAQVKAELAEAQRTGNIRDAETGLLLNQLFPSAYPDKVEKTVVAAPTPEKAKPVAHKNYDVTVFDVMAQRYPQKASEAR